MFEAFIKNGWMVIDLLDASPVWRAREMLEKKLTEILGTKSSLENYYISEDTRHTDIQVQITRYFREEKFGPKILAAQAKFFYSLLGYDLFVQANPYLRITRPHKPQDNIGYHRDTFYGGSPYELSVLVPFVNVAKESALRVLSGSHVHAESEYPTHQVQAQDVTKGSEKHQLGFLYAPKLMDLSIETKMEPIPLKIGQALLFSLATVHGSRVNEGTHARWSSDMRIMHAFAPVDLSARPDYYRPLCYSPVSETAKMYFRNNGKEREDVELELCHTAP